jgi:branched-chain amino acid transport system permease protein
MRTVQQLINGVAIGGVYALFATGYTLVFSVLRIVNLAHGAVFTMGAYLTYLLMGSPVGVNGVLQNKVLSPVGLSFPLALLIGSILSGLAGLAIERIAFRPLRERGADPILSLVSSLGVALVLVNLIRYLVGADPYSYRGKVLGSLPAAVTIGALRIRTIQLVIFFVSLVTVLILTALVTRTRQGRALQAVAEDPVTSRLLGIDPGRLIVLTFVASGFIGGLAGTLVGVGVSIAGPDFGTAFGLKGLAVIVLGGLGDLRGAVLGGLTIGIVEAFVPSRMIGYKDGIAFLVLFIVLLLRPQGLLGRAEITKV